MIVHYVYRITVPLPLIVHRTDTDGKLLLSLLESSLLKAVFFNAVRGIQGFIEVIFFPQQITELITLVEQKIGLLLLTFLTENHNKKNSNCILPIARKKRRYFLISKKMIFEMKEVVILYIRFFFTAHLKKYSLVFLNYFCD